MSSAWVCAAIPPITAAEPAMILARACCFARLYAMASSYVAWRQFWYGANMLVLNVA